MRRFYSPKKTNYSSNQSSSKGYYDDDYYDDYYSSRSYSSRSYSRDSTVGFRSNRSSSYDSWSWGNFGNYDLSSSEEVLKDSFIKNNEGYFTPKASEIYRKVVSDVRNIGDSVDFIKEMSRFFYHRMIDDKDYIDERFISPDNDKDTNIANKKTPFYEDMWDKFIPGTTPLEKAISVFEELVRNNKDKDGNFTKKKVDSMDLEDIAFNESLYSDAIYNELMDANKLASKYKFEILARISLIQKLGSEFKIEKEVEEKIISNSHMKKRKIMRDYSQIVNIDLYQRKIPGFKLKFLTKDLSVTVPIEKTEHKQKILFLLDYSGSMADNEKQLWVVALLIDRLRFCAKEEAELFFSYYLQDPTKLSFTHITNKEQSIAFLKRFSTKPNGGDTALGLIVEAIRKDIEDNHKLYNLSIDLSNEKPEILAISDGNDTVKTEKFTYKTNAITLMNNENPEIKKLCVENKGKYVIIDRGDKMVTYDSDNNRVETKLKKY